MEYLKLIGLGIISFVLVCWFIAAIFMCGFWVYTGIIFLIKGL